VPAGPDQPTVVVVVAGGDPPDPRCRMWLPIGAPVVAADSGADHAMALGLAVDELVGDLDSVSAAARQAVEDHGGSIRPFPADKDWTDLELALGVAAERHPDLIVVVGGHGGRVDHHLAGLLLLGAPRFASTTITAWHGPALLTVVRPGPPAALHGPVGSLVSLVPLGAGPRSVTTTGLRYPLRGEPLFAGTTRGVSNGIAAPGASVAIGDGVLLAIQPDRLDDLDSPRTDGSAVDLDPEERP